MHPDAPAAARVRRAAARARLVAVAAVAVLITATHIPSTSVPRLTFGDKVYHFGAYAGLSVILLAAWELSRGRLAARHYFGFWLAATLFAAADELTQIPVGRSCDVDDWAADVLGVVAGVLLFRLVRRPLYHFLLGPDARHLH